MSRDLSQLVWKLLPKRLTPPDVGVTPHEVLAGYGRSRLLAYAPTAPRTHTTPVLFVPSLVNRHYVLDLLPDHSVAGFLLATGFPAYMLDWGIPGPEDAALGMDGYLERLHRAVTRISRSHGGGPVTLVGYCMGGTMSLTYAAAHPDRVRNLVLLAAPADTDHGGLLTTWARTKSFDLDQLAESFGLIPAWLLQAAFTLLKPTWMVQQNVALASVWNQPEVLRGYLALTRWVNDNIPVSGAVLRDWAHGIYRDNGLVRGTLRVRGAPIRLERLDAAVCNVIAAKDHIIPPACSRALAGLLPAHADQQTLEYDLGHLGLAVGPPAFTQVWADIYKWLAARSA